MAKNRPYDNLDPKEAETYAKLISQIRSETQKLSQLNKNLIEGDKVQVELIEEQKKKVEELRARYKKYTDELRDTNAIVEAQVDGLSSIAQTVRSMPEMYEHFKEGLNDSLGIAGNIANSLNDIKDEGLKDMVSEFSSGLQTSITNLSDIAQLNKEDKEELNFKSQALKNQYDYLTKLLPLIQESSELSDEQKIQFQQSLASLQKMTVEAAKFANQSEEYKEVFGELIEDVSKIGKGFRKVAAGIELFLSSTRNRLALVAFGIGELAHHFAEVNKELGVGMTQMLGLKTQASLLSIILGEESGKAVIDLAKHLGDAHHLTTGMSIDAALLAANYGMSAEEAAFMSVAFGEMQGLSYDIGKNTSAYVKELALANYVAPAGVMKDIAGNTEFFALFSKDGGKNIGDAAVAAARLGSGLETVGKMADHLLDYQSSIQDEMEASVLLGRELNLGKARELMYQGNIEEGMKAALEAAGGINEYNQMDYYQRQALAKALGVSNAELQQMVAHEETLNGMHGVGNQLYSRTGEILTAMGNSLTGKIFQGMSALLIGAGQLNMGLTAMGTSLMGLLNPLKAMGSFVVYLAMAPFRLISGTMSLIFGKIINSGIATKIWGGFTMGVRRTLGHMALTLMGIGDRIKASTVLTTIWGTITKGVGMAFNGIMSAGKWMLTTMFPNLIAKMTALKAAGSIFGGGAQIGEGIVDKVGTTMKEKEVVGKGGKTIKAATKTKKAAKAAKGVSEASSLVPMAAGLTAMGTAAVAAGALNLILAGVGFTAMIPGSVGAFLLSKINLIGLGNGLIQLAAGLTAMSGTFMGSLALAAAAIAFTLMIPASLGMALFGITAPIAATGLGIIGTALVAFGALAPVAGIGIAMLAGLAGAFALFGYGVSLIGDGIKKAVDGISSMISLIPVLAENMMTVTSLILPIFGLAAAITALSVSLAALAVTGTAAIPALAVLGFTMGAAGAIFGGGKKDDEIIELLQSIDSKIGVAPVIKLDGKKQNTDLGIAQKRVG